MADNYKLCPQLHDMFSTILFSLDSDILTQMNITVSILDDVHNSMLERMIDEVALVSGEIGKRNICCPKQM